MLRDSVNLAGGVGSDDRGATAAVAAIPYGSRALAFLAAGGDMNNVQPGIDYMGKLHKAGNVLRVVGTTPYAQFVKGETQVLVCTTVIEVGVDVPNASLMVIESAERHAMLGDAATHSHPQTLPVSDDLEDL